MGLSGSVWAIIHSEIPGLWFSDVNNMTQKSVAWKHVQWKEEINWWYYFGKENVNRTSIKVKSHATFDVGEK